MVDDQGTPRPETDRVVRATDTRFARAALDGLRMRRFTPASVNGPPAAQVVEVDESMERRVVVSSSPGGAPPPRPTSGPSG